MAETVSTVWRAQSLSPRAQRAMSRATRASARGSASRASSEQKTPACGAATRLHAPPGSAGSRAQQRRRRERTCAVWRATTSGGPRDHTRQTRSPWPAVRHGVARDTTTTRRNSQTVTANVAGTEPSSCSTPVRQSVFLLSSCAQRPATSDGSRARRSRARAWWAATLASERRAAHSPAAVSACARAAGAGARSQRAETQHACSAHTRAESSSAA
jgi:hypothetical protein